MEGIEQNEKQTSFLKCGSGDISMRREVDQLNNCKLKALMHKPLLQMFR